MIKHDYLLSDFQTWNQEFGSKHDLDLRAAPALGRYFWRRTKDFAQEDPVLRVASALGHGE
jgi:hypothetical protein